MKKNNIPYILTALILIAVVSLISSCGKPPVTEEEKVRNMLMSGTWQIQDVTVDGVNKNSLFNGFTIKFNDATYTTTNGGPIWPASGTWHVSNPTTIVHNGGDVISISSITETSLVLNLEWDQTTLGGGRVESVSGNHTFTFSK